MIHRLSTLRSASAAASEPNTTQSDIYASVTYLSEATRPDFLIVANQLSLDELRRRLEPQRKQQSAVQSELEALRTSAEDQQRYLRLVDSLTQFGARLRSRAGTMEVTERQKILRLLAREVLVGTTQSPSGTAFRFPLRTAARRRLANRLTTQSRTPRQHVIFCVRGVLGPPCGVPSTLGLTNPFSITPAFRNARMSFSSRLSSTRLAICPISLS